MARVKIFPACERLICAQNSIFDMMRARSGLVGVRGAAVRDDGGPPSVPGRGRGGPLQQHRQHGGQVGRSSGGGRRLGLAVCLCRYPRIWSKEAKDICKGVCSIAQWSNAFTKRVQ